MMWTQALPTSLPLQPTLYTQMLLLSTKATLNMLLYLYQLLHHIVLEFFSCIWPSYKCLHLYAMFVDTLE